MISKNPNILTNRTSRRVEVLNAVFMEQISSYLSTGEVAPELVGLGLQISKVQVASNFSVINIFWAPNGKTDDLIQAALPEAALTLRHELTQRRVIGMVPEVRFVKDSSIAHVQEVERLLKVCDFGDDFTPTPSSKLFNNPSNISELAATEMSIESPTVEVVKMRQDILGVDREKIMQQVVRLNYNFAERGYNYTIVAVANCWCNKSTLV